MLSGSAKRIKRRIFNFWRYEQWLVFFHPLIFLLLVASAVILYLGFIETQHAKIERFRWIISQTLGVRGQDIEYIGEGWLSVPVERKTPIKSQREQATYTFNPFRWLFSSDAGLLKRRGVWPFQYTISHPIVCNSRGDIWYNRSGSWAHGKIQGRAVQWDTPQILGKVKVSGHEISTQDKKLQLIDK